MPSKPVRTEKKQVTDNDPDSQMREAFQALMAEVAQAKPRTPRHFELNEDQIAYIRAAYKRGICYDKISERGLTVWQPFPGRDWLRVHKPEWEAK